MLNTKINDVKERIPDITNLATNTTLTDVENKVSNNSDLVRKADYHTKISETEKKNTTSDYNKFMNNILEAKIRAKN